MLNPISSILQNAFHNTNSKFTILTWDTHEAVQHDMSHINANFVAVWQNGMKKWDTKYRNKPNNYVTYDITDGINKFPNNVVPNLILMQNRLAHGQQAHQLSNILNCPIVGLEHCMPVVDQNTYNFYRKLDTKYQVFITEHSRNAWGYNEENSVVILHGIDTEFFKPLNTEKNNTILSVANDFKNRGPLLGFDIWQYVVQNLPITLVGDTPGLSKPAASVYELRNFYQRSRIFFNSSTISPIPHSLLEAAACGCCILTTATCAIPQFFKHEENCLTSNDPKELRKFAEHLLANPSEADRLGQAARQTIIDTFGLDRYIKEWNDLFNKVIMES